MNSRYAKVLGLFPYFGPRAIGGVQASAQVAWDAISKRAQPGSTLVAYAKDVKGQTSKNGTETLIAHSKAKAILTALARKWTHDFVFVWHLGLLRLLPFFRLSNSRLAVMLLGIEAWKQQGGLTRKGLDKVDLFLTISDHTWRTFVEFNPAYKDKQHQTVYLGIGDPLRGETPEPAKTPAALMISRLSKGEDYKGHREVIEAWPLALQSFPNAELWIVGEGDLRSDLETLVTKLELNDSVHFYGLVSEERKAELLRESRCLLMPSRSEGFGLVYLEAMRIGRPCLVSTMDAGREVVNPPEAGLEVDPDDQNELANAIRQLLTDGPQWQRWSQQARRRFEENFTAKHFQDRLLAALFPSAVSAEVVTERPASSHV